MTAANATQSGTFKIGGEIEVRFVILAALLVEKGFLTEVGDAAVSVQIHAVEIVELVGKLKDFRDELRAELKGFGGGVFVELADVRGRLASLSDLDFDKLRETQFENFAEGDGRGRAGRNCGQRGDTATEAKKRNNHEAGKHESHCNSWMRTGRPEVR